MGEEITVYVEDMETFLTPEEYQAFVKAKTEVEEYEAKKAEHDNKKAEAERRRDECQKKGDEAKDDVERSLWGAKAIVSSTEALMPAPYQSTYYLHEHDHSIDLVRQRKLKQLEEQERKKAEEEAERRREEERKQREQQMMIAAMRRKTLADSEWQKFQKTLNSAIKELKHQLANPKPPKFAHGCSPEVFSYHPENWCDLELPGDGDLEAWAKPQILEKIPEVLQPFVTWKLAPQTLVIPKAEYQLIGVPCVVWHFNIYIAAKVDLWLKDPTITKEFHGWKYVAPIKTQKIGSFFLKARFWGSREGLETPVALLALLADGKLEAPGIEVEISYTGGSIYTVAGFKERRLEHYYIGVQEEFRQFIEDIAKDQSLGQGLLAKGILGGETIAKLIEAKWGQPLPVSATASGAESLDMGSVVTKLVEIGWTEADAKKALETTAFPVNITAEEMLKIILEKSY